jgi:hypothetical protein
VTVAGVPLDLDTRGELEAFHGARTVNVTWWPFGGTWRFPDSLAITELRLDKIEPSVDESSARVRIVSYLRTGTLSTARGDTPWPGGSATFELKGLRGRLDSLVVSGDHLGLALSGTARGVSLRTGTDTLTGRRSLAPSVADVLMSPRWWRRAR